MLITNLTLTLLQETHKSQSVNNWSYEHTPSRTLLDWTEAALCALSIMGITRKEFYQLGLVGFIQKG